MLNSKAFANSFAAATIIVYLIMFALKAFAQPFFQLLLNTQFFGADIASQAPNLSLANALGVTIAVGVFSWVFGYLIAAIYNVLNNKL